jgi:hypothetical protein
MLRPIIETSDNRLFHGAFIPKSGARERYVRKAATRARPANSGSRTSREGCLMLRAFSAVASKSLIRDVLAITGGKGTPELRSPGEAHREWAVWNGLAVFSKSDRELTRLSVELTTLELGLEGLHNKTATVPTKTRAISKSKRAGTK